MYDHSEDQQQKDTILLNYCIDDIEGMLDSFHPAGLLAWAPAKKSFASKPKPGRRLVVEGFFDASDVEHG